MATVKKAAPAKKAAAKTAVKKTAAKKAATPGKAKKAEPQREPTHQEIAALAAKYWAERGYHYHDGQAQQDWLRAERELRGH